MSFRQRDPEVVGFLIALGLFALWSALMFVLGFSCKACALWLLSGGPP